MSNQITVSQLKDQSGTPFPRPCLFCPLCGNTSSAHAGDYWNVDKSHVFTCCGEPMRLVVKRIRFDGVKP